MITNDDFTGNISSYDIVKKFFEEDGNTAISPEIMNKVLINMFDVTAATLISLAEVSGDHHGYIQAMMNAFAVILNEKIFMLQQKRDPLEDNIEVYNTKSMDFVQ